MFFFFVFIVIILGIAIHTSRIGIEIQNLVIDTQETKGKKINEQSKIYVYLLIFGRIKFFKRDIKKINLKLKNKDIDVKFLKNEALKTNYKELIENIDIDVKKIDLYVQIGTEDAVTTAIIVGVISGILGIILKKPKYQIIPIYSNKNLCKIKLECIISIYLMQYIYIIVFKIVQKKKQKKESNRCKNKINLFKRKKN